MGLAEKIADYKDLVTNYILWLRHDIKLADKTCSIKQLLLAQILKDPPIFHHELTQHFKDGVYDYSAQLETPLPLQVHTLMKALTLINSVEDDLRKIERMDLRKGFEEQIAEFSLILPGLINHLYELTQLINQSPEELKPIIGSVEEILSVQVEKIQPLTSLVDLPIPTLKDLSGTEQAGALLAKAMRAIPTETTDKRTLTANLVSSLLTLPQSVYELSQSVEIDERQSNISDLLKQKQKAGKEKLVKFLSASNTATKTFHYVRSLREIIGMISVPLEYTSPVAIVKYKEYAALIDKIRHEDLPKLMSEIDQAERELGLETGVLSEPAVAAIDRLYKTNVNLLKGLATVDGGVQKLENMTKKGVKRRILHAAGMQRATTKWLHDSEKQHLTDDDHIKDIATLQDDLFYQHRKKILRQQIETIHLKLSEKQAIRDASLQFFEKVALLSSRVGGKISLADKQELRDLYKQIQPYMVAQAPGLDKSIVRFLSTEQHELLKIISSLIVSPEQKERWAKVFEETTTEVAFKMVENLINEIEELSSEKKTLLKKIICQPRVLTFDFSDSIRQLADHDYLEPADGLQESMIYGVSRALSQGFELASTIANTVLPTPDLLLSISSQQEQVSHKIECDIANSGFQLVSAKRQYQMVETKQLSQRIATDDPKKSARLIPCSEAEKYRAPIELSDTLGSIEEDILAVHTELDDTKEKARKFFEKISDLNSQFKMGNLSFISTEDKLELNKLYQAFQMQFCHHSIEYHQLIQSALIINPQERLSQISKLPINEVQLNQLKEIINSDVSFEEYIDLMEEFIHQLPAISDDKKAFLVDILCVADCRTAEFKSATSALSAPEKKQSWMGFLISAGANTLYTSLYLLAAAGNFLVPTPNDFSGILGLEDVVLADLQAELEQQQQMPEEYAIKNLEHNRITEKLSNLSEQLAQLKILEFDIENFIHSCKELSRILEKELDEELTSEELKTLKINFQKIQPVLATLKNGRRIEEMFISAFETPSKLIALRDLVAQIGRPLQQQLNAVRNKIDIVQHSYKKLQKASYASHALEVSEVSRERTLFQQAASLKLADKIDQYLKVDLIDHLKQVVKPDILAKLDLDNIKLPYTDLFSDSNITGEYKRLINSIYFLKKGLSDLDVLSRLDAAPDTLGKRTRYLVKLNNVSQSLVNSLYFINQFTKNSHLQVIGRDLLDTLEPIERLPIIGDMYKQKKQHQVDSQPVIDLADDAILISWESKMAELAAATGKEVPEKLSQPREKHIAESSAPLPVEKKKKQSPMRQFIKKIFKKEQKPVSTSPMGELLKDHYRRKITDEYSSESDSDRDSPRGASPERIEKQAIKRSNKFMRNLERLQKISRWIALPGNAQKYVSSAIELMVELHNATVDRKEAALAQLADITNDFLSRTLSMADYIEIDLGLKSGILSDAILEQFNQFYSNFIIELELPMKQQLQMIDDFSDKILDSRIQSLLIKKEQVMQNASLIQYQAKIDLLFSEINRLLEDGDFSEMPNGRKNRAKFFELYNLLQPELYRLDFKFDANFFVRNLTDANQFRIACQKVNDMKQKYKQLSSCEQKTNQQQVLAIDAKIAELNQQKERVMHFEVFNMKKQYLQTCMDLHIAKLSDDFLVDIEQGSPLRNLLHKLVSEHLAASIEDELTEIERSNFSIDEDTIPSLKDVLQEASDSFSQDPEMITLKHHMQDLNAFYTILKAIDLERNVLPPSIQQKFVSFIQSIEQTDRQQIQLAESSSQLTNEMVIIMKAIVSYSQTHSVSAELAKCIAELRELTKSTSQESPKSVAQHLSFFNSPPPSPAPSDLLDDKFEDCLDAELDDDEDEFYDCEVKDYESSKGRTSSTIIPR